MFSIHSEEFGVLETGEKITKYTISNGVLIASFLNYGATLFSFQSPDRNGVMEELTLMRDDLDGVLHKSDFFGATIGRYAFRIKHGEFDLENQHYKLFCNNGNNHLHGGKNGFHTKVWNVRPYMTESTVGLEFSRISPDGEEGYPGNLNVIADYYLNDKNELIYEFKGLCDKTTIMNMTNHAYWNLSGNFKRSIANHKLQLDSDFYYDGPDQIPNPDGIPVKNTFMDFTSPRTLSPSIDNVDGAGRPGIDHAFLIYGFKEDKSLYRINSMTEINDCRYKKNLRYAATLSDEESGRQIQLYTTECALIVYSCNWLEEEPPFAPHYSVCLEPGYIPNSINCPSYPSNILEAHEPFYHKTVLHFSTL